MSLAGLKEQELTLREASFQETTLRPLEKAGKRHFAFARLGMLALTLFAFAWRVQGLAWQSLWRDEVDAIHFATRYLPETLMMFVQAGQNGPLYFLALRPWFDLVGTSEFALRYPSAMAGTVAVLLTWRVAAFLLPLLPHKPSQELLVDERRDRGESSASVVAWLASTLMAFNPYQLWYGQEGKMYAVITMLVLLATWLWLQGITLGGWRPWLAYTITVSLAIYTHLLLILLFPVHFVWFWLAWPQSRQHWRGYLLALAGLTLPYLPMVWWQWALLISSVKHTGFSFTPPLEMARTLLYNHSRGFMPPGELIWLVPVFFLGAAGLLLGMGEIAVRSDGRDRVTNRDYTFMLAAWRRWALVVIWAVLPVVGIYALSLRQPVFTDRYVIWIAPAFMMLVALGLVVVRRYALILGRPLAAMLLIYLLGFWLYAGWQQKTEPTKYDLRGGVAYLSQQRTSNSLLLLQIPYLEWAYRYYTSDFGPRPFAESEVRLAPWEGGLWTNQGWPDDMARQDAARQMADMVAGYEDIWVLHSEVEMWDQRHLMEEWLREHGELLDQADFHGVQVRHYRLADRP